MRLVNKNSDSRNKAGSSVDMSHLDASFQLLRDATMDVSREAVNAARSLEQRLHESENRFTATIDSIDDIIMVKDCDGRWCSINRFAQNLLGIRDHHYKGRTNEELSQMFPRLIQSFELCSRTDELAWKKGAPYRFDQVIETEYSIYYFDVVKTPIFNEDGSRKEIITIGRDVTDVREKQRRTKACFTAMNSASDMILIADSDFRVFFCNDRFMAYFNVDDYNNIVGERLIDIIPNIPNFITMLHEVHNNHIWEERYDGRFNLTILPMMNGVPQPIYYILTFKEITRDKYTINQGEQCGANE